MSFLEEEPQGDETTRWGLGIVAPLPAVVYGLMCIVNRAGAVPGRRNDSTPLFGIDAIILGVMCLSFASFFHFHYFGGLSPNEKLREYYEFGKSVSLITLILSVAWIAWCMLRGFTQLY